MWSLFISCLFQNFLPLHWRIKLSPESSLHVHYIIKNKKCPRFLKFNYNIGQLYHNYVWFKLSNFHQCLFLCLVGFQLEFVSLRLIISNAKCYSCTMSIILWNKIFCYLRIKPESPLLVHHIIKNTKEYFFFSILNTQLYHKSRTS